MTCDTLGEGTTIDDVFEPMDRDGFDDKFSATAAAADLEGLLDDRDDGKLGMLLRDAFDLMVPGAPFVQFTYSVASPLPRRFGGFTAEASERIWMNIPPARVWVYRKG